MAQLDGEPQVEPDQAPPLQKCGVALAQKLLIQTSLAQSNGDRWWRRQWFSRAVVLLYMGLQLGYVGQSRGATHVERIDRQSPAGG